jgi:hypothetical protein
MSSVRLLQRADWEQQLRDDHRCKPISESDEPVPPSLRTSEWWVTEHQFVFPVSVDHRGNMRFDDFEQLLIQLQKLRPLF